MKTVTKTTLEVGDLVSHAGKVWLAERMDNHRPCEVQCAMHDGTTCPGYCWRWDNGEDFVFRFILPDIAVKDATTIVATPDLIAERLAGVTEGTPDAIAKAKYYEKYCVKEGNSHHTNNTLPISNLGAYYAPFHCVYRF